MAALVLSVAGGAAGAVFGPAGAIAGRIAGALVGNLIDQSMFPTTRDVQGPRLADLDVMASTEGAPIPRVYGRARLSAQVIWATNLEEVVTARTDTTGPTAGGKGGGGPSVITTSTTYSYFANFAVGLCEGEIGRVGRIWANGNLLDVSGLNIRFYPGSETQPADGLIVAKEGVANAPAYRGLAYVVFERLPLADFGNRIPQLSFEIIRPIGRLERMTRAVTLIPGGTEFDYDTNTIVRVLGPGQSAPENRHITTAPSDVIASLRQYPLVTKPTAQVRSVRRLAVQIGRKPRRAKRSCRADDRAPDRAYKCCHAAIHIKPLSATFPPEGLSWTAISPN